MYLCVTRTDRTVIYSPVPSGPVRPVRPSVGSGSGPQSCSASDMYPYRTVAGGGNRQWTSVRGPSLCGRELTHGPGHISVHAAGRWAALNLHRNREGAKLPVFATRWGPTRGFRRMLYTLRCLLYTLCVNYTRGGNMRGSLHREYRNSSETATPIRRKVALATSDSFSVSFLFSLGESVARDGFTSLPSRSSSA
jgi:hypothetical protein